jgi:FtsP/CotA-like multicopper oxidase with cupredoxin domain
MVLGRIAVLPALIRASWWFAANGPPSAWTFGSVPGPALEAQLGEVLEVVLHNRDVGAGVTLHWHGYDVPNAMDGVAGATQDAVLPGQSMTYRFVAGKAARTGTTRIRTRSKA